MNQYYTWLTYQGSDGTLVHLNYDRAQLTPYRWTYRLGNSRRWYVGGKDKFQCLLAAAHHCGKSGAAMDWEPVPRARRKPAASSRLSLYKAWAQPASREGGDS